MATRIRLQRHGRKSYAFYSIVIADSRAQRDGKFIEKIGTYNPNTNPATVDLNFDAALAWVLKGAQPSGVFGGSRSYELHQTPLGNPLCRSAVTVWEPCRACVPSF